MNLKNTRFNCGYQQVTSLSSAAGLTVPVIPGNAESANYAVIQCESQVVRWRDDGTNPTTTVGMRLSPGQTLNYDGDLSRLKFIEEAASAKLNVSYYA